MESFFQDIGSGKIVMENRDSLYCYRNWPAPTVIIVDGPYGVGGYDGDPTDTKLLPAIYEPHIEAWSKYSKNDTTLWFWGTELGWARMHQYIELNGWTYEQAFIWNKGMMHAAGNVNSKTIRHAPVVTEICVRYTRKSSVVSNDGIVRDIQSWIRYEWKRTGLPFVKANDACGVKSAATRKYLTCDGLWYFPPVESIIRMANYANTYGNQNGAPYFLIDGKEITQEKWLSMRAKWNHIHGHTNVWDVPQLRGGERIKDCDGVYSLHYNQKPKSIMNYIIETTSDVGDVVWDPFCGLGTSAICCRDLGRSCYSAEINEKTFNYACQRLSKNIDANIMEMK